MTPADGSPEDGPGDEGPKEEPSGPPANASRRQFALNAVSSYASLFAGIILSLLVTRVLLRHLGAGTYGLWVVLVSLVGYLGLLDAGVSTAVSQRIARMTALGDRAAVADLLRTATVFFSASGALAVLVVLVVAPFLSSIVHLGPIDPTVAGTTLVILGVMTAMKFINSVPAAVLFGSGRADRQAQIGLIGLFATQIAQVVVVLAGGGLIGLGVVTVAGTALGLVMNTVIVRRINGDSLRRGSFDRAVLADLLRFGGRNTVVSLGGTVAYGLDAVIIGIILPVAQVAPYDVALSTANLTRNLTTQGTDLLLPTYAHFDSVEDAARQSRLFSRSVLVGLTVAAPLLIALAGFGYPILKLWLGSVPPKTYSIMIALGLVTTIQLPGHQCFVYLTGIGRNQVLVRLAVISASVNLAGTILFTYLLGPIGPAIGSLPTVTVIDFTILPVIVCRYLGMPFARYVRGALLPAVPIAAAAGAVTLLLLWLVPVPHGASTVGGGVHAVLCGAGVVAAAWVVALWVFGRLEPELRASVLTKLRRRPQAP